MFTPNARVSWFVHVFTPNARVSWFVHVLTTNARVSWFGLSLLKDIYFLNFTNELLLSMMKVFT